MAKQKFNFGAIKAANENISPVDEPVADQQLTQIEALAKKINNPVRENNFEVKIVPRKKIRFNKKNKYAIRKIEMLEKSILYNGLQQNLCGIYSMEEDMYILETGHKRTTAIDNLIEKFSDWDGDIDDVEYQLYLKNVATFEKGYPVKISAILDDEISYDEADEENLAETPVEVIDSEIRLHETNLLARDNDEMTAAERTRFVQRLSALYEEKNKRSNYKDRININKTIAEQLGKTERQVATMRSVSKLIPGLQEEFDKNNISLKEASGYASLSEEEQQIILNMIQSGNKVTKEEIALLKQQKEEESQKNIQLMEELEEAKAELEKMKQQEQEATPVQDAESMKLAEERLKELQKKDAYIKQLEKNVADMQKSANVENKRDLAPVEMSVLKRNLTLRNSLKLCNKEMSQLYTNANIFLTEYNSLSREQQETLNVIDKEELLRELQELEKLIGIINKKITE